MAVGDFNADDDPDLAVANRNSNTVSVLIGGAGGTFTGPIDFPAGDRPASVAVGDFIGDDNPDLASRQQLVGRRVGAVERLELAPDRRRRHLD